TPGSELRTVVWQQELDGVPVFNAKFVGHLTKHGELVNVASGFVADLDGAAARSFANRAAVLGKPAVSAARAVAIAGRNVGEAADHATLVSKGAAQGAERREKFSGGGLIGESEAHLTYFPLSRDSLRLGWDVIVTRRQGGEMFRIVVDAETGELLLRHGLTAYISNASYNIYPSDSPSPFSPGHATPLTNQPPVTNRVLVTWPAYSTNASPNGWIDDADNETRGNNVDAHLDRNNDNLPDLPRPQGAAGRVFDFPHDLTQAPTTANNQAVAVVQLFYLCNLYHDKLYEIGFTEAAGNFQNNNFGRGGVGNDAVQADAQDGGGFNNANFSTPPDGSPGRMQMYLFNTPVPNRDGDFDVEVVFHEHTHGVSNRRVGNGVGISALQTGGMGEGWSDWFALTLLAEPGDDLSGNYAAGGYVTYQLGGLLQNYYYGIRRYPYSTNLSKNPLTFKDIDPAQASTHVGIPRSPIIGNTANEVHNMGEVWCVTLWEARVNLINKLGFTNGNQTILKLVYNGLGLSAANPNFLEARDAIIQADLVMGGTNRNELWAAFAKRGMGFSASSPASSTTTGLVEAFDLPDDLRVSPGTGLTANGPVFGPFNPSSKTYVLTNISTSNLTWTASASSNWVTVSSNGGTLGAGGSVTNLVVSINSNATSLPMGIFTNVVRFTNVTSGRVQTRPVVLAIGQPDAYTELFDANDVDVANKQLALTPDGSSSFYGVCRRNVSSFPSPAGANVVTLSDDSFIQITLSGGASIPFYGVNRTSFFIGSNGYITFGSGDTQYAESLANHFNLPRIAGFFVDFNPPAGGTISWQQFADRVVVTWLNVIEFGTTRQDSVQIEMFFDGRITITHLGVQSQHGLVGLSRGTGVPAPFVESDLTAYPICLPPFTLTVPTPVAEGNGVLTNQGRVTLGAPLTNDVIFGLQSSDTNEIVVPPSVTVVAGQTNGLFNVTVIDDAVVDGPRNSTITATSPGFTPATAIVTVNDNEPVRLTLTLPATAYENVGVLVNQGVVRSSLPPVTNVAVFLASSNTAKLQLPTTVTLLAGQTSAVFNVTIVDNAIVDGTFGVAASARVANWTNGTAMITIFDDETAYGAVDHFELSAVASNQFVNGPFPLTVTARTGGNQVVSNFLGTVSLRGLRVGDTNRPVEILSFAAFADIVAGAATPYSNTIAAIALNYTNISVTPTFTTSPATLAAELQGKQVFLIPQQIYATYSQMNSLGAQWGAVLRDFVGRGGVVIACSDGRLLGDTATAEYLILHNSGLMDVQFASSHYSEPVDTLVAHPVTEGVPGSLNVDSFGAFTTTNATVLLGYADSPDYLMVVGVRDYGLGHAVFIGAVYETLGSDLDRVVANAVKWSQTSRFEPVTLSPGSTTNFITGIWSGQVAVGETATNMFLSVTDNSGHFGAGNLFNVLVNHPPVASNLSFTILVNTLTNLPLGGFDSDGTLLTYSITQLPTNGLLSAFVAVTNLFGYAPVHAFVGSDSFTYIVSDGATTTAAALVNLSVVAGTDTDGDGIPDAWEISHGLNPAINDASLDPDGDGLTNLEEYLADSDPHNAASGSLVPQVTTLTNGFYRLTWRSVGGVRYRVQFSNGGANGDYNSVFADVVRSAANEIDPSSIGTASTMTFTDDFTLTGGAPAQGKRYYRVKLIH
ncbi:MAG TPA: M36 family metallopeptidase, partial [Verrucomicrobiae bacterium]